MDFSTHNKFHSELFFYIFIWQLDCNLAAQLCLDRLHDAYFVHHLSKTQYTPPRTPKITRLKSQILKPTSFC